MNKLGLILMAGFVLVGCASEPVKDPDALPNGIMQPVEGTGAVACLLYTSPSPRDATLSRMPSSA